MKTRRWLGLVMLACFCSLGMGSMNNDGMVTVPEPEKNYYVTLIDQSDVSIDLEKFSCNGKTYFTGKLGRAEISIDFDKIDSILFFLKDDHVQANVKLKDGKVLETIVGKKKSCYGKSSFADVKILMQDIKMIVVH